MSNKENSNKKEMSTAKKEALEWLKAGIITFIVFLIINSFVFTARVEGQSMSPNLQEKDLLFVSRQAYKDNLPEYEDIIVFDCESRGYELIKRVIGLPGDHIEIKDGKVYRNGTLLDESHYLDIETSGNVDEIVKENHLFVLGDNRNNSADSRYEEIGQVSIDLVKGKTICRFIPNFQIFK